MLSGAMFRETPQASVRMRMRLQHAVEQANSYTKLVTGKADLVLSEDQLRFDTWFEPLGTSGSTPKIFDFALDFDQSSIDGGPLTIDLGTLGKQTIPAPQFALNVGFRPELVTGTQELPGSEAPRLSPLLSDAEARMSIATGFTPIVADQDIGLMFNAAHGLIPADIGKIFIDDTGARFRLMEIGVSTVATFRALDRPDDPNQTTPRLPVGGLTPPAAFYELILPIDYAADGVPTGVFSPRFVASGFDEIVADDPRLLLVNDSEWEMKTLLDEAPQRFSDVWLQRDGALSQFDQLLRQSVGSTDGLSGFMTQGMALLHGKSFIDLIEDPDASVDFDTGLANLITQHLGALNDYDPTALPKHFTGADIHSDLRAYVEALAQKLSEITGLGEHQQIDLLTVTTGDSTSASTLQEMDDTLSVDGRLLEEVRYRIKIQDLVTYSKTVGEDFISTLFDLNAMGITRLHENPDRMDIDGFEFGLYADLDLNIDFGLKRDGGQFEPFIELSEVIGNVRLTSTIASEPLPEVIFRNAQQIVVGDKTFNDVSNRATLKFAPSFVFRPSDGAKDFSGGITPDIEGIAEFVFGLDVVSAGAAPEIKIDLLPGAAQGGQLYEYIGSGDLTVADLADHDDTQTSVDLKVGDLVQVGTGLYEYIGDTDRTGVDLTTEDYSDAARWAAHDLFSAQGIFTTEAEIAAKTFADVILAGGSSGFLRAGGNTIEIAAKDAGKSSDKSLTVILQPNDDLAEASVSYDATTHTVTLRSGHALSAANIVNLLNSVQYQDEQLFDAKSVWAFRFSVGPATIYQMGETTAATLRTGDVIRTAGKPATGNAQERIAIFADGTTDRARISGNFNDKKLSELPGAINQLTFAGDIRAAVEELSMAFEPGTGIFGDLLEVDVPFSGGKTIAQVMIEALGANPPGAPAPSIAQALRFDDLIDQLGDQNMDAGTIGLVAARLSQKFDTSHPDITTEDSPVTFDYDVRTGELLMHFRPSIPFAYEARAALRKEELAVLLGITTDTAEADAATLDEMLRGEAELYVEPNIRIAFAPDGSTRIATGADGGISFTIAKAGTGAKRASELTDADKSINLSFRVDDGNGVNVAQSQTLNVGLDGQTSIGFTIQDAKLDVTGSKGEFRIAGNSAGGEWMTVEEAQTDLAMVVLQKQLSASDDLLAQAPVVIDDVLDLADDVARAEAALTEIEQRVALLPSFDKTVVYSTSDADQAARDAALMAAAESDNPALAARLAWARAAVTAAETALTAAQGTGSALATLIANLTTAQTALTGQGSVAALALQALQKSGGDASVSGAFATLEAQSASKLSQINGMLTSLNLVQAVDKTAAVAGLTDLQADLDLQAQAQDLFDTLETYAVRAAAAQDQARTAVAQIALSAADPLGTAQAVRTALVEARTILTPLAAQVATLAATATTLDTAFDSAQAAFLTDLESTVAAAKAQADGLSNDLSATLAYVNQIIAGTDVDLEVIRDLFTQITLAEAALEKAGAQYVASVAEALSLTQLRLEAVQESSSTKESRALAGISALATDLAALDASLTEIAALKTAAETAATQALADYKQVLPDEGGQQNALIPDFTVFDTRIAALDTTALDDEVSALVADIAALASLAESDLQTALAATTATLKTAGIDYAALVGTFTSDRLPQLDFSSLDAVLSTDGAVAALNTLDEKVQKVQLAMRSQLPPVVTAGDGAAVQAGIDYTASSLANLRFRGLDGLTSVQLGSEATDLAGTVDIALEALLSLSPRPRVCLSSIKTSPSSAKALRI